MTLEKSRRLIYDVKTGISTVEEIMVESVHNEDMPPQIDLAALKRDVDALKAKVGVA